MGSSPEPAAQMAGLQQLRAMNAELFNKDIPVYRSAVAACHHHQFTVYTNHDGEYDVPVLVHTPQAKKENWL